MRFLLLIGFSLVATHIVLCGSERLFNRIETVRAGTSKNNNEASSIAIQADGKILIAGSARAGLSNNFAVVRYNPNGALDASFDTDGIVTTDVGTNTHDTAFAIAIQSDGKIVVAGLTVSADNNSSGIADNDFAIVRYNANGSLDTSFGRSGKVVTKFGADSSEAIEAIAIHTDGKIVAVGSTHNGSSNDFAVARYNADGSLDASFNNNGKVITAISKAGDLAHAVAIMPDGKIVVAGGTNKFPNSVFAIVRYNTNGTLDSSFDGDGTATTEIGANSDVAEAIAVLPDGKIIVAGSSLGKTVGEVGAFVSSGDAFALVKYNTNGSLDASFGQGGKAVSVVRPKTRAFATSAAIQSDGKLLVAGYLVNGFTIATNFVVARFNANGTPDSSFGQSGKIISKIGTGAEQINSVAVQSDGKILVAGYAYIVSGTDFAVVRYNANGTLDASFDKDGKVTTDVVKKSRAYKQPFTARS